MLLREFLAELSHSPGKIAWDLNLVLFWDSHTQRGSSLRMRLFSCLSQTPG